MIRVIGEGDAQIGVLPDVVDVVAGAAERLTFGIQKRMALDTTVPDRITGNGLTERVHGERNRGAGKNSAGTAVHLRIEGRESDPRERDVGFGRILELDRKACL